MSLTLVTGGMITQTTVSVSNIFIEEPSVAIDFEQEISISVQIEADITV